MNREHLLRIVVPKGYRVCIKNLNKYVAKENVETTIINQDDRASTYPEFILLIALHECRHFIQDEPNFILITRFTINQLNCEEGRNLAALGNQLREDLTHKEFDAHLISHTIIGLPEITLNKIRKMMFLDAATICDG